MSHHHALLCRSDQVREAVVPTTNEGGIECRDIYIEQIGIDDVRVLTVYAYRRPTAGPTQTLVVRTELITHEAQHALLKLLEEPPESTRFIFVLATGVDLLSTLQSRFQETSLSRDNPTDSLSDLFNDFASSQISDRLALIDVATKKKDVVWQRAMKQGLRFLLQAPVSEPDCLEVLEYVASHLLTRGASNKMLLEQLALSLPARRQD